MQVSVDCSYLASCRHCPSAFCLCREFFETARERATAKLRHDLDQAFNGPGVTISMGHVARFNVGWDEKAQKPNDRRLVIDDEVIGHTACTVPGSSGSLLVGSLPSDRK